MQPSSRLLASQPERGAIRRRIENGYLRDLGRPDETGRLTPPRAYLQAMLVGMDEPVTEAGLNRCLRGLAALSGNISREFAATYAEARADPQEAWANLSAMRAKGEIPRDILGWAKSDFDGADSFEWGDFEVDVSVPLQESMGIDETSGTPEAEAAHTQSSKPDYAASEQHKAPISAEISPSPAHIGAAASGKASGPSYATSSINNTRPVDKTLVRPDDHNRQDFG